MCVPSPFQPLPDLDEKKRKKNLNNICPTVITHMQENLGQRTSLRRRATHQQHEARPARWWRVARTHVLNESCRSN